MATLLALVQDITRQIGIPDPSTVIGNTDPGVEQILRLLHQAGNELRRDHSWSALTVQRTFTGVANQIQTGEPPAAFDRFTPATSLWNVGDRRECIGVMDKAQWLRLTVDTVGTAVEYWTMMGGVINILPIPSVSDSFRYMYVSKYWVRPTGQTTSANDKAAFTVDTDFPVLPDELLIASVIWRWKASKGLDYAEDMITYERQKEKAIGADRGPHVVHTASAFRGGFPANYWPWSIG